MLPKTLNKIVKFLQENQIKFHHNSRDGRINSAFNEDEVFDILKQKFSIIERPLARDWVDFSFIENKKFIPVNIKISSLNTNDNLNCKLGIYYTLTGKIPPFENGIGWENFLQDLKENLNSTNADYYFLIINKEDTTDVFATSLKSLNHIVPNGNNLPFQANWNLNRNIINRDFDSAKKFILGTLGVSLKRRAEAYISFQTHFKEYL